MRRSKRPGARAQAGEGPTLIEALTYRWKGHSKSDRQLYRTRDEVKEWQAKDPIPRFARQLNVDPDEYQRLEARASAIIEDAVAFADNSPEPDVTTILEGVYA